MLTKLPQHLRLRNAVLDLHLHHDSHCDYGRAYGLRLSLESGSRLQSQLPITQIRNVP